MWKAHNNEFKPDIESCHPSTFLLFLDRDRKILLANQNSKIIHNKCNTLIIKLIYFYIIIHAYLLPSGERSKTQCV
jgi:hypothetical protein